MQWLSHLYRHHNTSRRGKWYKTYTWWGTQVGTCTQTRPQPPSLCIDSNSAETISASFCLDSRTTWGLNYAWASESIILFVPRKPQLFMINAVACCPSRDHYAACLPAVRSSFWFLLLCLGLGIRFLDCFVSTYACSWEKWSSHLCRDKLMT